VSAVTDAPLPTTGSVGRLLDELVHRTARGGLSVDPVATGFDPLDLLLDGGFLPDELVLLGGRPGVGKTLTALQWARNAAGAGRPVAIVCFEHDPFDLLARLLVQEVATLAPELDETAVTELRRAVSDLTLGRIDAASVDRRHPMLGEGAASLRDNTPGLRLLGGTARTDLGELRRIGEQAGAGALVVVDYLQKIPVSGSPDLHEQVVRAVEGLKDLAVTHNLTVLALAAASQSGVAARRVRLEHLRGADALAHECDIGLVLNEKSTATASRHLDFDLRKLEASRHQLLLSVEKNRRGASDLHLEFRKDFTRFRVDPSGSFATDTLVDPHRDGER
jgi:replicative DNA helicase